MTVCVYPGTFDPFTYGHMSVVRQACRLFSHVRILVAVNPEKTPVFNQRERVALIETYVRPMPHVSIDFTTGYVVDYAKNIGASALVRGVRNLTDAGAELKLAELNAGYHPEIQTVFFPADRSSSDVSSTSVKQRVLDSASYSDMDLVLNPETYTALYQKIGKSNG